MKAGRIWSPAESSGMRILERSSRLAARSTALNWEIGSVCHSTFLVVFAKIASVGSQRSALLPIPATRAQRMVLQVWGRTVADRQNCYVCPMPTSTVWCSRPMLMKKKMITLCCPISFRPVIMPRSVQAGDSVVVYGAGPVGLMAAYSSIIKGASKVMVVDMHQDRLALAEKIGAIAINDSDGSGVEQVMALTAGIGADRGCECVGYQCCDHKGHEVPNLTMNNLVKTVRPTGGIGVVGVFLPEDPHAKDKLAKQGRIEFDFGQFWIKGQHIGTGQANVKAYNRKLCRLIAEGKAKPSFIISHELPLDLAVEAYKNFDARKDGWTKVVLKPGH